MDCAEKSGCRFIVAGGNCSVLFKLCEEILDSVAGLVEVLIIVPRCFAACFWRNDCLDPRRFQPVEAPLISVISLVCDEDVGLNLTDQNIGAVQIARLSRRQVNAQRIAQGVANRMDLGA